MATYTFTILEVSKSTFEEIAEKLLDADYNHSFHIVEDEKVIDMHGIALKQKGSKVVMELKK